MFLPCRAIWILLDRPQTVNQAQNLVVSQFEIGWAGT